MTGISCHNNGLVAIKKVEAAEGIVTVTIKKIMQLNSKKSAYA